MPIDLFHCHCSFSFDVTPIQTFVLFLPYLVYICNSLGHRMADRQSLNRNEIALENKNKAPNFGQKSGRLEYVYIENCSL